MERRVGNGPDVSEADTRVEAVEEEKRQVDVHQEQPGQIAVEGALSSLEAELLGLHRTEDPDGYVSNYEER